jgi:hypothetical protein
MPHYIDEFIYIPPHEWERMQRLNALLRASQPEIAPPSAPKPEPGSDSSPEPSLELSPESAAAKTAGTAKPTNRKVTKSAKSTKAAVVVAPTPPHERAAPRKRKATQVVHKNANTNRTTNTEAVHNSGRSKWTSLGHGFWYTPGPAVAAPWRQWTWRDVAGQLARCILVCVIVFAMYVLWTVW